MVHNDSNILIKVYIEFVIIYYLKLKEIREKVDNSKLRKESEEKSIPIVDLLLRKIKDILQKEKINCTLFSVCSNSENVLKAALRAAKRAHALIKFAATLNQVDIDRGVHWMESK
ncbi:MAG: hypothetical protein FJW63_03730 [Actinobacteria bacterium]|nr:hypothetical protein [Actinomycetota bacterium]